MRRNDSMRLLLAFAIALLLVLPSLARVVRVAELPASEFADTEVSTNVVIAVRDATRPYAEVSLTLTVSPSNGVEVSCDGLVRLLRGDNLCRGACRRQVLHVQRGEE